MSDDHAITPVGYQPRWTSEPIADMVKRAVAGLGDLIDDYKSLGLEMNSKPSKPVSVD